MQRPASSSSSAFKVPTDNATVSYVLPSTVSRAIVPISACGKSEEDKGRSYNKSVRAINGTLVFDITHGSTP